MIKILVALGVEAKPLIAYFKLNKDNEAKPFRLYRNAEIELVISGSGRINMAAATAWLGAFSPAPSSLWINIGTAGHGLFATGQLCIANKIQEAASQRIWYPPQIIKPPATITSTELMTVDQVQTTYDNMAYDMEASAFLATALRFSEAEWVQSLKIISDTPDSPAHLLTGSHVSAYIEKHLETINDFITALKQLQKRIHDSLQLKLEPFLNQWRFTVSQQHQLSETLRRWNALYTDNPFTYLEHHNPRSSADVLKTLNTLLQREAPRII